MTNMTDMIDMTERDFFEVIEDIKLDDIIDIFIKYIVDDSKNFNKRYFWDFIDFKYPIYFIKKFGSKAITDKIYNYISKKSYVARKQIDMNTFNNSIDKYDFCEKCKDNKVSYINYYMNNYCEFSCKCSDLVYYCGNFTDVNFGYNFNKKSIIFYNKYDNSYKDCLITKIGYTISGVCDDLLGSESNTESNSDIIGCLIPIVNKTRCYNYTVE